MSNEYDAAVTASLQPDTAQAARVGFATATDTNPDAYAEAKRVARRTGVPVDTVFAMPNEIKRQDAIGSIDFDALAKTSPSTAALLADVEKAKVAHDDVPGIGEIERKLRQFGGGAVEAVGMAASGTGRLLDVAQRSAAGWAGLMLPEPMAGGSPTLDSLAGPMIGEGWQGAGKIVKNTARNDLMVPAAQQTFGDQVAGGLGQVAAQILMLPFARGAGLYAQGADAMGEKIDGDNAPQWKKDLATVGGAGITGITEKWALDKLLGPMVVPVKNVIAASLARIGIAATAEGGQEFSENVLQDSLRKMMTNSEAKIDFGQSLGEGGVGAAVGGIVRTVVEAGLHIKSRGQQAQQATEAGDLLVNLNTMAEASKLVQRDAETAQGFFQSILDEGRDAVYVSPEALAQSGLAEQMAQSIPAVAEQLGTAAESGHDIRIPIADLMATMAGPELEQSLLPHVAVEPGGFTPTTAQEYLQSDQAKELQAEVDRVLGEKEGDDTFKASAQAVKTTVKDQLTTAGRFTESVNDAYSSMVGNFYAVQAARMGTTPEEMFKRYPLRIGAESIAGQQFDQGRTLQQLRDDLQKQQAGFDAYDAEIRGGVDPDGDKYFGLADKVTEAMDAFVADLEQIPDDSFSLQAKTKDGRMLLVNPSAQKPGHYQLTRFASDGNPWGDTQYPTKKQAIKDFLDESDASTVKDFGGQLNQSARLNTDTPEFRNWFGDSKVVDADGKPLVVYHGTKTDFDTFSDYKPNFFTASRDYASGYGDRIKPVFLKIEQPFDTATDAEARRIYNEEFRRDPLGADAKELNEGESVPFTWADEFFGFLYEREFTAKSRTYDGLIVAEKAGGNFGPEGEFAFVPLENTQIKSAIGNRGTFDPNDANILNQSARLNTDTPEFRNWFGDSKVVDADGKPMVVYHGTQEDITNMEGFDPDRAKSEGGGFYFSDSPLFKNRATNANTYAGKRGTVIPVYLKSENLYETGYTEPKPAANAPASEWDAWLKGAEDFNRSIDYTKENYVSDAIAEAKRAGADGVVLKGFEDDRFDSGNVIPSDVYIVFDPTQIKSATGNRGTFDPNDANILNQSAYHGTPYKFDKFSLDHIGRGEGAQAFGWGLYFAGKKQVAEYYRKTLSDSSSHQTVYLNGQKLEENTPERHAASLLYFNDAREIKPMAKKWIKEAEAGDLGLNDTAKKAGMSGPEYFQRLSDFVQKHKKKEITFAKGQLYEVSIPEDDDMLQWHKPITSQPESVKKALKDSGLWKELKDNLSDFGSPMNTRGKLNGENIYAYLEWKLGSDKAASLRLNELGIPGLKYPAGSIAGTGTGNGGFNYVVFDESAVDILQTYYQNEKAARGSFNPATLQLTLLKNADLSTFLHESAHFFLEVQADLSGQLMQDAAIHGADTLKPGEQQVVKDMQATLDWFGIKDLSEWNALDFEEKRSYHEKFARGFESYLFEGKAPSIELQGLFQRFRAWMMNVYRDLKALNVELTDEVRGVFDRMVATTEQITLAEQGRSMMPLFTSPEQIGMTPAEFADYQALGTDATNEAIEDLQARGLRDMQWIHNARGRVIKQLQKESAAKRAEVKMGVRAEVMSQPIYRAWQFLTGKMTADDQIDPVTPPKSDPNVLDETIDSLFAAIAKLGGINKDDVVKTWGVDPADKPTSGLFGKPLWRVEGGLSIDGMAEALSQYGYLDKDENGKWDIRELEEKFKSELGGDAQYSNAFDYSAGKQNQDAPITNPMGLTAGRLSMGGLSEIGLPAEIIQTIKAHKMTAKGGLHPDIVAEMFGFTSGDELVRRLAAAEAPKAEIEALTDQRMLEQFGDLSSEEAIKKAADKAIHNDVRARLVATELAALEKATGKRTTLASAAKEYAAAMIARLKVRDIKPGQYAAGEVRAAKATEKASKAGDLATAAAEKRNQLINTYATRAAYDAQEEVEKGLRYLKTFESASKRKGLDADYTDQIDALLERFDLRKGQSNKSIDKRKALAEWLTAQQDAGLEPDIPQQLVNEAFRKSYKDMTVEELRGLIDTIKQIEHLGRLKHKLLTARDQRAYEAIRDEIAASIVEHAGDRKAETRTPDTVLGKSLQKMRNFWAAHIKSAMWARIMDGGKDGGPMWEYFVRAANERGDMETTMRAEATAKLSEILDPVFKLGKMQAKVFFPLINRSLTREARIAIALNVGNASNLQRLQGGEVWTDAQLAPILRTLTAAEWQAVQQVWDHFESYRPQIAAKERRVYGKEPEWIAPTPFTVQTADGQSVQMRGGYYPVKYDPAASQRAEEHADAEGAKRQLQGAYTSATTRRSFTKTRAEEVNGRPLLYSLAGVYSGVNDVIHDLSWHEWLIDTNRLLRSQTIDSAIRNHYGPEVKQQFKKWSADIAEGDKASTDSGDIAVNYIRQSVSVAGLGFNVMSAAIQPLGITQSIVRVGAKWVGRGIAKYIAHPIELTREVNSMSSFMENRARTRFRELNELRNQVEGQTKTKEFVGHYAYFLMMRFQQAVDVPTWWGAYEKAVAEGNDDERAVSLADQAVIDSQGGGMLKDQAGIERTGATGKLFTVFYSFMNTAMNMGVAQTMTEKSKAKLVADYALLYLIPPMLGMALKAAITPGDSGDDDPEKIAKKLLAAQIDYMMGMMVYVREFSDVAKTLTGANDMGRDYQGPAGLRLVVDAGKFAKQVGQGEFDDAFRKASVNLIGDLFGLPSAQLNRTITGIKALAEGETENPAAIAFGFQKPR